MKIVTSLTCVVAAALAIAAGTPESLAQQAPAGRTSAPEIAQAATVNVEITTACEEGNAVFKVVNKGFEWPTVSKFSVYRVKGNTLVSQRRMRLTSNQAASFRVKAGGPEQVELGIFIEPEWYSREFTFDAKVSC